MIRKSPSVLKSKILRAPIVVGAGVLAVIITGLVVFLASVEANIDPLTIIILIIFPPVAGGVLVFLGMILRANGDTLERYGVVVGTGSAIIVGYVVIMLVLLSGLTDTTK